jgi:prepilin peptidase CpaA
LLEIATMLLVSALTATAAWLDVRTGRIPNALVYPAAAAGLGLGLLPGDEVGLLARATGLLAAFAPSFALFAAGGLGGGDVKLLAAVGALVGYPLALDVLFHTVVAGGVLALALLVRRRRVLATLREAAVFVASLRLRSPAMAPAADLRIPFGAAIFAGSLLALGAPALRVSPGLLG